MNPKLKNIILFIGILGALILAYLFLFANKKEEPPLISSTSGVSGVSEGDNTAASAPLPAAAGEFLSILLSVRSIKLDDSIFSDPAFLSLRDSSIELVPDGSEGRPNPFAPIGSDVADVPPAPPMSEASGVPSEEPAGLDPSVYP